MKPMITRVRAAARTDTTMELEIHLQDSKVINLHLNAEGAAAIMAAIVEHCPPDPARAANFPCYGFGTTLSAEGHTVLGFQLSSNRFPVLINVPQEKLLEVRAGIAKWETQRPGRAWLGLQSRTFPPPGEGSGVRYIYLEIAARPCHTLRWSGVLFEK